MKLKYYLRGLGLGMLVMMLILWATGNLGAKMSDEAVKRRAAELGMVEKDQTVLLNVGGEDLPPVNGTEGETDAQNRAEEAAPQENEQAPAEAAAPENNGQEPAETAAPQENEQNQTETPAPENNEQAPAETAAPENNEQNQTENNAQQPIEERADEAVNRAEAAAQNAPAGRKLTLTVNKGDSSVTVARKAAEIGLIKSAKDFDAFLCQNGYDKKISVGNYEIAEGASEKEIADIVTRRK